MTLKEKYKLKKNTQDFKDKQSRNSKYRRELKTKATIAEQIFMRRLNDHGFKHSFQKGYIRDDVHYIVDFQLTRMNVVIEIDGGYHFNEDQIIKDTIRDKYLADVRNMSIIRIKNEDVGSYDFSDLIRFRETREYIPGLFHRIGKKHLYKFKKQNLGIVNEYSYKLAA